MEDEERFFTRSPQADYFSNQFTCCYGLNCAPQIHVLEPSPPMGGAFGRCLGHEGGALMNGICAPGGKDRRELALLHHASKSGRGLSPDPNNAGAPILDFLPSEGRETSACCLSRLVCVTVLQQPSRLIVPFILAQPRGAGDGRSTPGRWEAWLLRPFLDLR